MDFLCSLPSLIIHLRSLASGASGVPTGAAWATTLCAENLAWRWTRYVGRNTISGSWIGVGNNGRRSRSEPYWWDPSCC